MIYLHGCVTLGRLSLCGHQRCLMNLRNWTGLLNFVLYLSSYICTSTKCFSFLLLIILRTVFRHWSLRSNTFCKYLSVSSFNCEILLLQLYMSVLIPRSRVWALKRHSYLILMNSSFFSSRLLLYAVKMSICSCLLCFLH